MTIDFDDECVDECEADGMECCEDQWYGIFDN